MREGEDIVEFCYILIKEERAARGEVEGRGWEGGGTFVVELYFAKKKF